MNRQRALALAAGAILSAAVVVALFMPDRGGQRFIFAPCDLRGVEAFCADLDSGAIAVVTSLPSTNTGRLIVFDPGGPGADLRSSATTLSSLAVSEGTVAVAFIEPWTTLGVSEGCRKGAEGYLASMRSTEPYALPATSFDLGVDCLDEVENAMTFGGERLDVLRYLVDQGPGAQVKYLGWSFASLRLAALADQLPIDGALIISPIRHDQSRGDLLASRARNSLMAMEDAGIETAQLSRGPVSIDDRSTDITSFDVAAAQYAAIYDIETNRAWLPGALKAYEDGDSSSPELASLATAADNVLGRYGINSLYAGIIGYWAEFCYLTAESASAPLAPTDSISWFLYVFHQPCGDVDTGEARLSPPIGVDVVCLVIGEADPLAHNVGATGWRQTPNIVTIPDGGHILSIEYPEINHLVEKFSTTDGYTCDV